MRIIVAKNIGFCFGVKRAVDMARKERSDAGCTVYTMGELIHNEDVVSKLRDEGIIPVNSETELKLGDTLIIRSHGAPKAVFDSCKSLGIRVIDATCPFVARIHDIVNKAHADGKSIVIVGRRDHPEVVGINGHCDFSANIAETVEEARALPHMDSVCVVAQTTFVRETYAKIAEEIAKNCADVAVLDTICDTTTNRQSEADQLSRRCTKMLVIGGKNSSNTQKLLKICKKNCEYIKSIENSNELPLDYFLFHDIIGIVAGASAPDWIIREVITRMNELDKTAVAEDNTTAAQKRAENTSATKVASKEATNASSDAMHEDSFAEQVDKSMVRLRNGQITTGTVVSVSEDQIWVSLGYKSDGYIKRDEFSADPEVKLTESVKPGDELKVEVIKVHDETGSVVLSRRGIEKQVMLEGMIENDEIIGQEFEVRIKDAVKSGLSATLPGTGIRVFIPVSLISLHQTHADELEKYVRRIVKVKVIKSDKAKKSLIGSMKDILLREQCAKLAVNSKIKGTVSRYNEKFGYFVDIGDMDGLIRFQDLTWVPQDSYEGVLTEGQEIEVVVLSVDPEKGHVSLGYKQLQPRPDPWTTFIDKFHVDDTVVGKVVKLFDFGASVRLAHGLIGFIHISEIATKRIDKVEDELHVGDEVKCKLIALDDEKHRISLSRKAQILEDDPELAAQLAREKEERDRIRAERAERDAQRAAVDAQRKERQAKFEQSRTAGSGTQQGEQQPRQHRERTEGEQPRADRGERRPRRSEDDDFELPPVEQATTSLAGLFSGLTGSDDNK